MQLVAYGAQDIYLTGNPQITFFKVVYRRHTNFAMEDIKQSWNGNSLLNDARVSCIISRNGDLLTDMWIEADFTNVKEAHNPGACLIKEVEINIGGQLIDKQYGLWMEIWAELTVPNDGAKMASTENIQSKNIEDGSRFQNLTGMGGVYSSENEDEIHAFIPLMFWFNRNPGLALPLIALQYHEVELKLTVGSVNHVKNITQLDLWCNYIYLDTDERRRFAQVSHEYLIEQVQYVEAQGPRIKLPFNHPVKEIIWTKKSDDIGEIATPNPIGSLTADSPSKWGLQLNGHERFEPRLYTYFTKLQVYKYHTGTPMDTDSFVAVEIDPDDDPNTYFYYNAGNRNIGVYSFALKPEEHQPSGTCNFSRIDNAILYYAAGFNEFYTNKLYHIFAVNYNVLRIMSGMGGLGFSN
jgi:hypothetical protein